MGIALSRVSSARIRRAVRGAALSLTVVTAGALAACSAPAEPEPPATTAPAPEPVEIDTSTIRTLIEAPPEAPEISVIGDAEPLVDETATLVTYPSGGLTVSAVLRTPPAVGASAPVVVVVHGSVDPRRYDPGTDLESEQRALLEAGYIVFALDMRGYGQSDAADDTISIDPGFGWDTMLDWGMALDVVNGLRVATGAGLPGADPARVGLLGHSLGGLLSLDAAVIAPGLSQLVVALSAPTADLASAIGTLDGDDRERARSDLPAADDPYWADVSPATFFERATEPLLLIHGSADDVAPAIWSEQTAAAWEQAGGRAEAIIIEGADHALAPRRAEVAAMVVQAFDAALTG